MHRISLLSIVFIVAATGSRGYSQTAKKTKDPYAISKLRTYPIIVPDVDSFVNVKNITGISLIDARADTSAIGIMQKSYHVQGFLTLQGGFTNTLKRILRQYVKSGKPDSANVLMVVRKLWLIDDYDITGKILANNSVGSKKERVPPACAVAIKAEFYYKVSDNYFPLFRFDSTVVLEISLREFEPDLLMQGLISAIEKLVIIDPDIDVYTKRHSTTLTGILEFNQRRFNIPALRDSIKKSGVYASFAEFQTNNPSAVNFRIRKDKLSDVMYVFSDSGNSYVARNVWGYADSSGVYAKCGNNFFKLQQQGNAYYIYGAKNLRSAGASAAGTSSYMIMPYKGFHHKPTTPFGNPHNNGPSFYSTSIWTLPITIAAEVYAIKNEEKPSLKNILAFRPYVMDWDTGLLY